MNGISTRVRDITVVSNNQQVDTNQGKADMLAKTFSDVSSDANYTYTFITHKRDIETTHTFSHTTLTYQISIQN